MKEKLNEILSYVGDEPIFFAEGKRLLCKNEIDNYKEEIMSEIDNIIPLIDLYDNQYLIYIRDEDTFALLDISEDFIYDKNINVDQYLELLKNYKA